MITTLGKALTYFILYVALFWLLIAVFVVAGILGFFGACYLFMEFS